MPQWQMTNPAPGPPWPPRCSAPTPSSSSHGADNDRPSRAANTSFCASIVPTGSTSSHVTDDGRMVLVEQYRHGTDEMTLEIPGGAVDPGERPETTAARELEEETGYRATELIEIGRGRSQPGVSLQSVLDLSGPRLPQRRHGESRSVGGDRGFPRPARGLRPPHRRRRHHPLARHRRPRSPPARNPAGSRVGGEAEIGDVDLERGAIFCHCSGGDTPKWRTTLIPNNAKGGSLGPSR